jgi:hypothetical protein
MDMRDAKVKEVIKRTLDAARNEYVKELDIIDAVFDETGAQPSITLGLLQELTQTGAVRSDSLPRHGRIYRSVA